MLKKITLILGMVVFVGVLAACGSENTTSGSGSESNSAPKEEPKAAEQKDVEKSAEKVEKEDESSEVKKDEEDGNVILETVGQVHEDENGIVELLAIKDINETIDMNPMTMTIEDIKIFNFKVEDEDMASYLSQWDGTW